ncbi:glycoside hydrolase family 43 protein [Paenibacillus sp. BC26]|uniref:glycoside hydrolase family 43 protein n=1 Tax=Paenibacillus sp. BC26 TaxID=1881032 RepID=UPI0008EC2FC6|nr:glycoside hydrolase family 43 protein [Paenibacillus sp. BC26]SFT05508.1 Glycosyl hydrolases family 43 [Paenibacillus sp. BC26]
MKQLSKLTTGLPLSGHAGVYENPLYKGAEAAGARASVHPDPYVLKHNGLYYCFATGGSGVPVMRSSNLVDWEQLGYAFSLPDRESYWAPAVIYLNGVFYMYVSSVALGETDPHYEYLLVATSDRPEGPYTYVKTLYDTFTIDAHVVKDDQGRLFLFYSDNNTMGIDKDRPGTVILVDRLLDPLTPEGKPELVVKPTLDEEIYEENRFGDGRNWHTIEGACYLNRRGFGYVMYSGNAFTKPYYFIGYSMTADKGSGISGREWRKVPSEHVYEPLMRRNDDVEGVGHHSVIKAPNNVDDWIVYHGRDNRQQLIPHKEQRQMRIDPLLWKGDRMWVPGPSHTTQDAPAMPVFRDLFETSQVESLSTGWRIDSGVWSACGYEALQDSLVGIGTALSTDSFNHFVYELNLKWEANHMGGLYGAYIGYTDLRNHTQVLLDVGKKELSVFSVVNGLKDEPVRAKLDPKFCYSVFHKLTISKVGQLIEVLVDDVPALTRRFPVSSGRIGLVTHYTRAKFAGVAVTPHVQLNAKTMEAFIGMLQTDEEEDNAATWHLKEGVLYCSASDSPSLLWMEEELLGKQFQFSVDLQFEDGGSAGMFQLCLSETPNRLLGRECTFKLDRAKHEVKVEGANGQVLLQAELPACFDFRDVHTLQLRQTRTKCVILLDEYLIYQGESGSGKKLGFGFSVKAQLSGIEITELA